MLEAIINYITSMDALQYIALWLLLVRIITLSIYKRVCAIQVFLLKMPIEKEVVDFRLRLHYMTQVLMFACVPSIVLDLVVLGGVDQTMPFIVVYAITNACSGLLAAIMIDTMYQLARNTHEVTMLERKHVATEKNKE